MTTFLGIVLSSIISAVLAAVVFNYLGEYFTRRKHGAAPGKLKTV